MKKKLVLLFLLASPVCFGQNLKISQLPVATTPLGGNELVPIVQGGVTKQVAASWIGNTYSGTGITAVIGLFGINVANTGETVYLNVDTSRINKIGVATPFFVDSLINAGVSQPANQIIYGTGTGVTSDALATRDKYGFTNIGAGTGVVNNANLHIDSTEVLISVSNPEYLQTAEQFKQNDISLLFYNNDSVYILPSNSGATGQVLTSRGNNNQAQWTTINGGITSIGIGNSGDAMGFSPNPLTSNGNINITWNGTSSELVNGIGNVVPIPGGGISNLVDTIYRTPGKDSIQFNINGRYYAILDSIGSGGEGGGSGTVTSFSAGTLSPLFTTSVTTSTSTPALSFSLSNTAAHTFLGNFTGSSGAPSYSSPNLASADFANQGTTTTVLHGNASGNPSWSAVNLASDVTGELPSTSISLTSGEIGFGAANVLNGSTELTYTHSNIGGGVFTVGVASSPGRILSAGFPGTSASFIFSTGDLDAQKNGSVLTVDDDNSELSWNKPTTILNGVTYNWTGTQGSTSTVLTNDGSGNLSWTTVSGDGGVDSIWHVPHVDSIKYKKGSATYEILDSVGPEGSSETDSAIIAKFGLLATRGTNTVTLNADTERYAGLPTYHFVDSSINNIAGDVIWPSYRVPFGLGSEPGGFTSSGLQYIYNANDANLFQLGFDSVANAITVYTEDIGHPTKHVFVTTIGDVNNQAYGSLFTINDENQELSWNKPTIILNGVTYNWTATQGSTNTVLTNDGSGNLSWASPSGDGSSSLTSTYIGYGNGSNTLTGDDNFIYLKNNGLYFQDNSTWQNIIIGSPNDTSGFSGGAPNQTIVIGSNAVFDGEDNSVVIGNNASGQQGGNDVVIGMSASTNMSGSDYAIAVGYDANAESSNSTVLGANAADGGDEDIVLGYNARATMSEQLYIDPNITHANIAGVAYNLPTSQGSPNTVLTNDGSGNLSWVSDSGGGGSDSASLTSTYIGYGSGSNTLTGDANFAYVRGNGMYVSDGNQNLVIGTTTSQLNSGGGGWDIAIGEDVQINSGVGNDVVIGYDASDNSSNGVNTVIGTEANIPTSDEEGSVILGPNATGTGTNNEFVLAPTITHANIAGVAYALPTSQGTANTVLTNDGSGNLSWQSQPGSIVNAVDLTGLNTGTTTITTYTNPDGSNSHTYEIGGYITIIGSPNSTHFTVSYIDENGNSQSYDLAVQPYGSTTFSLIPSDGGSVVVSEIRVGAGQTITITSASSSTNHDIGASIKFIN